MIREELVKHKVGADSDFHWRGKEVSRLEGFTDAVFGFIITLLVISAEVPKTFSDLASAFSLSSVGSFAICFLILVALWRTHYIFFRRYGLEDGPIFLLNVAYLFIIALYIYPLKFLFTWMLNGFHTAEPGAALTAEAPIYASQVATLMIIYALGLICVNLVSTGFYWRAYHRRAALELSVWELHDTLTTIGGELINAGVGIASILIVLSGGEFAPTLAGLVYVLILPFSTIYRRYRARQRRHLTALQNEQPS